MSPHRQHAQGAGASQHQEAGRQPTVGDETGQGWVGRLAVMDNDRGKRFTAYNLGIRRDTSRRIAMPWRQEWAHRILANRPSAIVAMFGINDCAGAEENYDGVDYGQRVEADVSLGIARNIITAMKAVAPVLWLGPTPLVEDMMDDDPPGRPALPPRLERLAVIDRNYAACAASLDVLYLGLNFFKTGHSEKHVWPRVKFGPSIG